MIETSSSTQRQTTILCCECGIPIVTSASSTASSTTCAQCLASKTDISRGITTEVTLHQCRGCQRWHSQDAKWLGCELESRELMSLCLNKIPGVKKNKRDKFRIVDASWIWTEPHSMRLKIRLTVQKEISIGTILQQSLTITFIVRNQQCIECQSEYRQGAWKSLVQVRQRVKHKRTFLFLEQLILKHEAHRGCLSVESCRDGMDFYFVDRAKATRFMSFLEGVVPIKTKHSKKLISMDDKSNVSNYKYTNLVEICPLCKDDLLLLSKTVANQIGNISRLVLVKNVTSWIHVVDPLTGQTGSISPEVYWRAPFYPIMTAARTRHTKFVVLNKEAVFLQRNLSRKYISKKQQSKLANLNLARECDLGTNDDQIEERSHVGYLLKAGDVCIGYDLKELQFGSDDVDDYLEHHTFPDVIILRKLYGYHEDSTKKRFWKLDRMVMDGIQDEHDDEEDFMREIETDKEMRNLINIYKSGFNITNANDDLEEDEEDDQQIKMNELLNDLVLDGGPDKEEEKNADWSMRIDEDGEKAAKDGLSYVTKEEARTLNDKGAAIAVDKLGEDFQY